MRAEGQALYRLLFQASLRGLIVRGPMAGKKQAYVLVRDWIPDAKPVDRDAALGEFARRYLVGHGPATDRDLARWAGIPLRDARAGARPELEELHRPRPEEAEQRRASASAAPRQLRAVPARVDLAHGHRGRRAPNLVTVGGMFYPFAMVRGRAVARWKLRDGGLELEPFRRLSKADRAALERDAEDVRRFLG